MLRPAHAVRPYVLRNTTDGADAKALLEALRNGEVRSFPIRLGAMRVMPELRVLIAHDAISAPLNMVLLEAALEIEALEKRVRAVERELGMLAAQHESVERLRRIPGVGLLSATAVIAFAGDLRRFPSARQFASYLGLTLRAPMASSA